MSAICAATVAILLLASMLFGHNLKLEAIIGVKRTARDIAIALWAFLLPAWFTLEEMWFAPKDAEKLAAFREAQQKARFTWVVASGAVAILIGTTAPQA
jgi:hypothetical protein